MVAQLSRSGFDSRNEQVSLNKNVIGHFMRLILQDLIKDISKADLEDICSCWQWRLTDQKSVVLISSIGDIFLLSKDETINWLETGTGELTKVADSLEQFEQLLKDEANIDYWFLETVVEQLIASGIKLQENEVYSFKKIPALGGDYSPDNFEPTDMSVHFAFTGQIHEQIKDLPPGTKINTVQFQKG